MAGDEAPVNTTIPSDQELCIEPEATEKTQLYMACPEKNATEYGLQE